MVIWNGMPYMVPLRHIRPHVGLANVFFASIYNSNAILGNDNQLVTVNKLMDIIEGTSPGQQQRVGKNMLEDGTIEFLPPDLQQQPPLIWHLAQEVGLQLLQLENMDGILYGIGVKRVHACGHYRVN